MDSSVVSTPRGRPWPRPWQLSAPRPDWLLPARALNELVFFPYRYARLTELLSPHLRDVATVLDVGASCGRLARRLIDTSGCRIVGIDVRLQPRSYIEVRHYDGRTFPFADGDFDCVLMVDALHHSRDVEQLLREARRVSRRYVLIKDHYWDTRLDRAVLRAADYLGNAPYGIQLPTFSPKRPGFDPQTGVGGGPWPHPVPADGLDIA